MAIQSNLTRPWLHCTAVIPEPLINWFLILKLIIRGHFDECPMSVNSGWIYIIAGVGRVFTNTIANILTLYSHRRHRILPGSSKVIFAGCSSCWKINLKKSLPLHYINIKSWYIISFKALFYALKKVVPNILSPSCRSHIVLHRIGWSHLSYKWVRAVLQSCNKQHDPVMCVHSALCKYLLILSHGYELVTTRLQG